MLFNIKINKETLEIIEINDSTIIVNEIKEQDGIITLEISKPDPEIEYPWQQ
jgi:hypothetical protein